MSRRDFYVLLGLACLIVALFSPVLFQSQTYFFRDLTFLHHPWKSLAAEMLQKGEIPLWNPYGHFGMPLAANFQSSVFYPGSVLFYFFPFPWALKLYHFLHYFLACFFAYLWLRSLGCGRLGCSLSAVGFALGGFLLGRLEFLNLIGVLCYWPCLFLFSGRPLFYAAALALAFFSGHPQFWAGMLASHWILEWALGSGKNYPKMALGLFLALGICSCLALPGWELIQNSRRQEALDSSVRMDHSFTFKELGLLASPVFSKGGGPGEPKIPWFESCYWGIFPALAALLGFSRFQRRRRIALGIYLGFCLLLLLGSNFFLSEWLWKNAPAFQFIRYPTNLAYLPLPALMILAAQGARSSIFLAAFLEIFIYGWRGHPSLPHEYYTSKGPLVETLQKSQPGRRFLLSPQAQQDSFSTYLGFKHRLSGLAYLPFHLESATGAGEPLIPAGSRNVLNFLESRRSLPELSPHLDRLDIKTVLTAKPQPSKPLVHKGNIYWEIYETQKAPLRAYWTQEEPDHWAEIKNFKPLIYRRIREDRVEITGFPPEKGTAFVADSYYPGWQAYGDGKRLGLEKAFGAFKKISVPENVRKITLLYRPFSFFLGLILSFLSLFIFLYTSDIHGWTED